MSEQNDKDTKYSNIIVIIILVIVVLLALYLIFFKPMQNNTPNNNMNNTQNSAENMVKDTVEIADANAKELYERVKKGITLNGKLIEVPKTYMDKITKKVTATGYKITDDTKKAISAKLDEIENILRSEGKTDINELSSESKEKIKGIYNDIDKML